MLAGKVSVVTGAASGIGLATASLFAEQGAAVIAVDVDEAGLAALGSTTGRALTIPGDVTDPGTVARAIEAAEREGGIDILVNNAGIMLGGAIADLPPEQWDRVFEVNVRAAYLFCKAALAHMLRRKHGAIVNISSVMALRAEPASGAYSASKAAILALTRDIAVTYATEGVRCNAVCPGWVDTRMNADFVTRVGTDEAKRRVARQQPIGRMLQPREIASAVVFLSSDAASAITGVSLPVDGGMSSLYSP